MSLDAKQKNRPVDIQRLLRPQNRIDLIISSDLMSGNSDVRSSIILDITPEAVIVAQTERPILKSMTDTPVEATIVHHNLVTYEPSRWGWQSKVLGINNNYRLTPDDPSSITAPVVFLSPPPRDGLKKTNVRLAYRIDVSSKDGLIFEISPDLARVSLINFSAIGVMLLTDAPPPFSLGQKFTFVMTFPDDGINQKMTINGEAVVVRFEYEPGDKKAKVGLKYLDLPLNSSRNLEKAINAYMLEEQRKRRSREGLDL